MTPTALYRHYDAEGQLLYVGVSANPTRRMYEHKCRTEWAHSVARTEIVWFDDASTALETEKQAIANDRPCHNAPPDARLVAPKGNSALAQYMRSQPSRPMREWAEQFGISRPHLIALMDGERLPSLATAKRIEDGTGGAVPISEWSNIRQMLDDLRGAAS